VGDGLEAGSLILTSDVFLLTIFYGFFGGGIVAATLRLLARVLEDLTLGLVDELSANSTLRVWAEIETTGVGILPSKPRTGAMKLSKA
jgi:hypothetical protein